MPGSEGQERPRPSRAPGATRPAQEEIGRRIDERAEEFVGWLLTLASIPSVSATGEGVRECAAELASLLRSLGIRTEILETGGAPLVWGTIGEGSPRVVVYGHYDVQPAGPVEDWRDPPFSPTIREDAVWGRGVGDNKGQLLTHLCALAAWLDIHGSPPPFELVFAFDGEEEIGSPSSIRFISRHPEYFAGDFLYVSDGSTLGIWEPAVFLELHGLLYLELRAHGASAEWHSGSYGALLPNPVQRLAAALSTLVDERGRVHAPGFYDDVVPPTAVELELAAKLPPHFLSDPAAYGASHFISDSPREAMFFVPKLCICGFHGGYTGDGVKTAVPTEAVAKIDVTLAPNQDPERIAGVIRSHLDANGFQDVSMDVLASCPPVEVRFDDPFVQKALQALTNVWGRPPIVFPSIGGGGPLAAFAGHGMTCMSVPYGQADLHEHSVEEHIALDWFLNGVKTSAELFRLIAEEATGKSA